MVKPSSTEGISLIFRFFPVIPYYTISSIGPVSSSVIGSATRLKNSPKGHWLGVAHFTAPWKTRRPSHSSLSWLDVSCLLSLFKPLIRPAHLHRISYSHQVGEEFSLTALLHYSLEKMTVAVVTVLLWLDFRLQALGNCWSSDGSDVSTDRLSKYQLSNSLPNVILLVPVLLHKGESLAS